MRTYLQAQVPAMRAAQKRKRDLELYQAEQEQIASRHAETMALDKETMALDKTRIEAQKQAQKESADIAREGLRIQKRSQEEAEKQAEYGTWLQAAGLALQAYQSTWGKKDPWDYTTNYGYDGGWDDWGGDGWGGGASDGGGYISYSGSW